MKLLELGLTSLDFATVSECVEAVENNRLAHLELYIGRDFTDKNLSQLEKATQSKGIGISCISTLAKLAQAEEDLDIQLNLIYLSLEVASKLGVKKIGFMYGGNARLNRVDSQKRFISRLKPVIERAEASGITILIENLFSRSPSGDLDSVEVVSDLFDRLNTDYVKLNFDVGNFAIAGEEAFPYAFEYLQNIIGGIHLKDVSRYRSVRHGFKPISEILLDHRRGLFISEALGEGILNSAGFISSLLDWRECPPVTLEFHCSGEARNNLLNRNLNYINQLINERSS